MATRILSSFEATEQSQPSPPTPKIPAINPAFATILRDRRHRGSFRAFNTTELGLILSDPLLPDSAKLVLLLVAYLTYWSKTGTRKLVAHRLSPALGETLSANAITKHLRRLRDLGHIETALTPTQSLQVTYCLPVHYWTALDEAPLRQPLPTTPLSDKERLTHLRHKGTFIAFNAVEFEALLAAPLTPAQKIVFLGIALQTHFSPTLTCTGTTDVLAKLVHKKPNTVLKHLAVLKAEGFIGHQWSAIDHETTWTLTYPAGLQEHIAQAPNHQPEDEKDPDLSQRRNGRSAPVSSSVSKPYIPPQPRPAPTITAACHVPFPKKESVKPTLSPHPIGAIPLKAPAEAPTHSASLSPILAPAMLLLEPIAPPVPSDKPTRFPRYRAHHPDGESFIDRTEPELELLNHFYKNARQALRAKHPNAELAEIRRLLAEQCGEESLRGYEAALHWVYHVASRTLAPVGCSFLIAGALEGAAVRSG